MAYIGSTPTSQNFISGTDYFNGTGSQTAFTLTRSVNSVNDVEVVVNNVIQQPNSYTVSGTTLTLSAAPSSGTSNVYVRYLSTTQQSITVPANSIDYNKLDSNLQSKFAMKNRIINGAMVIDQRNAGASVNSSASGTFSVDRFTSYGSGGGVYTTQQSSDVPTGAGFVNSIVSTVTTIDSPTGVDYYLIQQGIEGYNAADLQWGTASAKTITLSFWVKSSITGTYTASVRNSALDRSYRATYTINSANTWEQKSVTIAGDTTGTWLKTNGMGISVGFALGAGATLTDTGNVWSAGQAYAATGQTQWIATNGATFYITGVQLEVGSSATSYEYRQYQQELALCQRYYQSIGYTLFNGVVVSGNSYYNQVFYKVSMRAAPTVTYTNAGANGFPTTASTSNQVSTEQLTCTRVANSSVNGGYFVDSILMSAEL